MQHPKSRLRRSGILCCTLCGREIGFGEEYWACNGERVCTDCLGAFARREFFLCRETRGKEQPHDAF